MTFPVWKGTRYAWDAFTALAEFFSSELLILEENTFTVGFVHANGVFSSYRYPFKMWLQVMQFMRAKPDSAFPWQLLEGETPLPILHKEGTGQLTGMVTNIPPAPVSGSVDPTSLFTGCTGARNAQFPSLSFCFVMAKWRLWLYLKYYIWKEKFGSVAQDVNDLSWRDCYSKSKHLKANWCLLLSLSPSLFCSAQVTPTILAIEILLLFFHPITEIVSKKQKTFMESNSCKKILLLLPPKVTSGEAQLTSSQNTSLGLHHYKALKIK